VGSAFSEGLATGIIAAPTLPLPTTLSGLTAVVTDASGRAQNAQLFFISPNQLNFLVPANAADGSAKLEIKNATDTISTGTFRVASVAPAVFSVTRDGLGTPAGQYTVIRPDGSRVDGFLFTNSLAPQPLNVTTGQVYVILYGTGMRNANAGAFTASVGNRSVPILAVGASSEYPGLDQIAVGPLPASLAGAGKVTLTVTSGGIASNPLSIVIE
jgi:uncharacterized protein (TIGR03437 family)